MSIRKLARQLGVTDRAIRKAMDSGRISPKAVGTRRTKSGKTQRAIVNPVLAADDFSQNTDHRRASDDKPLESGVADEIAKVRLAREKTKTFLAIAKAKKYTGELIDRQAAHQEAASVVHARLSALSKAVSAKRLTKDELRAAIGACELEIMDDFDKHFAPNAD